MKVKKDQGNKNWKTLCKIIQEWWTKLRDEQLPLLAAYHNEVKNLLEVAFLFHNVIQNFQNLNKNERSENIS